MADWVTHGLAFLIGAGLSWLVRGALDRAVTGLTLRALVSEIGPKKVGERMKSLKE